PSLTSCYPSLLSSFLSHNPATTHIYTLSLHDALPISDQVLKFEVALPETAYPDSVKRANFFEAALGGVASLPGVSGTALTSNLPASNVDNEKTLFTIEGRPALQPSEAPAADLQTVSRDYFSVLKIPLMAGRF